MINKVFQYVSPSGGESGAHPGAVVMEHVKVIRRDGSREFLYRYPDPRRYVSAARPVEGMSGWVWGKPGWADYMLYGLERLQAIRSAHESRRWVVYWTEGEKDADSINALNLPRVVAVSHHGGAGKATDAQTRYLEGWLGRVVVCTDRDGAGDVCALARYRLLRRIGIPSTRLSVRYPAGKFHNGRDVTDHLEDGYALNDLRMADLKKLAAKVAQMPPAQRRDGSGWKTGDPEVDTFDMRSWSPLDGFTETGAAGGPSSRRPPTRHSPTGKEPR